ncbi:MAG: serine hydrolase [Acidobacteria bacterium]|nr:serine hydrolase [Acidobacteriota bacterium]
MSTVARQFLVVVIGMLLTARSHATQPAAGQGDPRIDAYVRGEMARQKIPGVALGVVRKGIITLAQGYGLANVEHDISVTPSTIFQSGSVGKQFTAAVVMLLVEEGKLSLNDTLPKFFADAPPHWRRVTVRHLLTHTSGIPDYTDGTIDYRRDQTEDELVRFAHGLKPEFEPGARWNYSNTGYVILGAVVRKASGQFYGDVLRDRVFGPMGIRTGRIISEEDIVPHRASGYRLSRGVLKNQEWVAPRLNTTADGSLYLSLQDMLAWDAGVRIGKVLKPESWRQVFSPVSLNSGKTFPYGFGWSVENFAGRPAQRHGGSWQGFKTHIARFPEDDLTIVVLANLAQADPEKISDGVAAIIDPKLTRPELKPLPSVDAAMEGRVRRLLADAVAGTLTAKEFAYVRAGFFPEAAKAYASMLREAGELRSVTLLENRELGDDRVYTYDVSLAQRTLRLRLAVAPDGKLAAFNLSPAPSAIGVVAPPSQSPTPRKEAAAMSVATGTFDVKLSPQTLADGSADATLGRLSIDKQFHGGLEGTSRGEMLSARTAVNDSAGYVAIERVTATLDGRKGTFVLQHGGIMNRGQQQLTISVVPDSGTGELSGLVGTMSIRIADGKHFYGLQYSLK